jgi:hypothetical protein
MTFGYGVDATDSACKDQRCETNIGRSFPLGSEKISTEGDYDKPRRVPENLSWVHLGFDVTLASRDASEKVDVTG